MTEFQLALLVIGALVVAGVFVYNRLQERGARRAAERAFRSTAGDALLADAAAPSQPGAPQGGAIAPPPAAPPGPHAVLPDARIDYVVELSFTAPPSTGALLEHWRPHEHRYARRACLAYSSDGSTWRRLVSGDEGLAHALQAGLQLVTREGTVDEAELIEFRAVVEALAAATGAGVHAPEMRQAVERARELDRFCAQTDLQVVFHVMPPPGARWVGSALRGALEKSGLRLAEDGRFANYDDTGRVLFCVGARDGVPLNTDALDAIAAAGLSITLDVPRAPGGRRTFQAMAVFARQLAAELGGALVDDNDQALEERSLAVIETQLDAVHAAFSTRGIEPGSDAALRLFS